MNEWSPEIVRARFHEAADTERHLPLPVMMNTGKGFWPTFQYTAEDMEGWDKAAEYDHADRWARSRKLTRDAISRHDECLDWSIRLLQNELHRHVVWKWAFCQAYGRSFGAVCQRKGWVRTTAYGRLDRCFVKIADYLINADILLRLPEEKYLEQSESAARTPIEYAPCVPSSRPAHQPFRTEKHVDTLTTPASIAAFAEHLIETNGRRRKVRARKEREPAEAA